MKKKLPIGLRKILDDMNSPNENLFLVKFSDDYLVKFIDLDDSSDFFFQITKINLATNDKTSYAIQYKPWNELTLDTRSINIMLESFRSHFTIWKNLLIESNIDSPLFDDSITKAYYNELEPRFEIVDKDANYNTFSINQQHRIIAYLNTARKIIEQHEDDDKEDKIESIKLIDETIKVISKTTKKEVLNKIRKIIAKGYKIGLQVGEKLVIEFTTELAKKLIVGS